MVPITHEHTIICSETRLDGTTHEQTIICRQLFAGHVVGCRPMEGKKKLHRMIIRDDYIQLSTARLIGYPLSDVQPNLMEYLLHITKKEGLDFLKCRQKGQMNAISRQVKFSVVVFLAVPPHLKKFTLLRKSLDIYYDYY